MLVGWGLRGWAQAPWCSPQAHGGLRPCVLGVPPAPRIFAALFVTWAAASVSGYALGTSAVALGGWLRGSRCPLRQLRAGPQLPALRPPAPYGRPLATLGLQGERLSRYALRFCRLRAEPPLAPAAFDKPLRLRSTAAAACHCPQPPGFSRSARPLRFCGAPATRRACRRALESPTETVVTLTGRPSRPSVSVRPSLRARHTRTQASPETNLRFSPGGETNSSLGLRPRDNNNKTCFQHYLTRLRVQK